MAEPLDAGVVGRHYDERTPIADELRDGQLHMWYFYDRADDATLVEAVHRITTKVTDTLGLRPGEQVLDAGCGPGETAVHLARTRQVRVTGVTVSDVEIATAQARARAAGVEDLATFQYGDYTQLPFADATFDAVLALESLQNAVELPVVLAEFYRVLKPGGRLSFSDFSLENEHPAERIATFRSTLKLPNLPRHAEWLELTHAAGFTVEEHTQCGPRVFGMKAKYLEAAMARRDDVAGKFGDAAVSEHSRLHRGFFAPRTDQVGYVIVAARKPEKRRVRKPRR